MGTIHWNEYPNFSADEFRCKCGCDSADMDADFLAKLQQLRDLYNRPITITSGYRCPAHNSNVSSTGASGPHTTGKAADIAVFGNHAWDLLYGALALGFSGVGIKQHGLAPGRFIHLDTITDGPRPWIWSYK